MHLERKKDKIYTNSTNGVEECCAELLKSLTRRVWIEITCIVSFYVGSKKSLTRRVWIEIDRDERYGFATYGEVTHAEGVD